MQHRYKYRKKIMEKQEERKKLPKHGYINELAKLCNCNRNTVRRALFEEQQGEKSDLVRKMYKAKYKDIL